MEFTLWLVYVDHFVEITIVELLNDYIRDYNVMRKIGSRERIHVYIRKR